jgi:hypothetical protein
VPDLPRSSARVARVDLWGRPLGWLVVIAGGALALRLVGLDHAPRPNEDVVQAAWNATHGALARDGGLVYVIAPFERFVDSPSYETARAVVLGLGVLGVAAAWWLGRVAYGTVAGFVAAAATAVDTAHVASSRQVLAVVPLATLAAVALALLALGKLEWAGAAIGAGAAIDFSGWLLLVPLLAVGWGAWRRVGIAAALAAVISLPAWFALDDRFTRWHSGWPTLFWHGLGPVLAISAVGLAGALIARSRADVALASFVLAYGVFLLAVDRRALYTLPVVPALGALAGRFRGLAPVALLLLVLPLTWSIRDTRELKNASTMDRREAARSPASARPGGVDAARVRLLGRRGVEGRRAGP